MRFFDLFCPEGGTRVELWARGSEWRDPARLLAQWTDVEFRAMENSVTNKYPLDIKVSFDVPEGAVARAYVYDGNDLLWSTNEFSLTELVHSRDGVSFSFSLEAA